MAVHYLAVLQIVGHRHSVAGQFAFLSDQHEADTKALGKQRTEQETSSVQTCTRAQVVGSEVN